MHGILVLLGTIAAWGAGNMAWDWIKWRYKVAEEKRQKEKRRTQTK